MAENASYPPFFASHRLLYGHKRICVYNGFRGWKPSAELFMRLALVQQAGKQYAQTGRINEALLAEIGSPMIPEEQYVAIVNGGMEK